MKLAAFALFCLSLAACGTAVAGPDEVTATVTEGDEEAWSAPDDPASPERDDEEDDEELDGAS